MAEAAKTPELGALGAFMKERMAKQASNDEDGDDVTQVSAEDFLTQTIQQETTKVSKAIEKVTSISQQNNELARVIDNKVDDVLLRSRKIEIAVNRLLQLQRDDSGSGASVAYGSGSDAANDNNSSGGGGGLLSTLLHAYVARGAARGLGKYAGKGYKAAGRGAASVARGVSKIAKSGSSKIARGLAGIAGRTAGRGVLSATGVGAIALGVITAIELGILAYQMSSEDGDEEGKNITPESVDKDEQVYLSKKITFKAESGEIKFKAKNIVFEGRVRGLPRSGKGTAPKTESPDGIDWPEDWPETWRDTPGSKPPAPGSGRDSKVPGGGSYWPKGFDFRQSPGRGGSGGSSGGGSGGSSGGSSGRGRSSSGGSSGTKPADNAPAFRSGSGPISWPEGSPGAERVPPSDPHTFQGEGDVSPVSPSSTQGEGDVSPVSPSSMRPSGPSKGPIIGPNGKSYNPGDTLDPREFYGGNPKDLVTGGGTSFNPGNLKLSNSPWQRENLSKYSVDGKLTQSEQKDEGTNQIMFANPVAGAAGSTRLAMSYYSDGNTTLRKFIGKYSPNHPGAAAAIAKRMGIGIDDDLDLKNPKKMLAFQKALYKQEVGPQTYGAMGGDSMAERGVMEAFKNDYEKAFGEKLPDSVREYFNNRIDAETSSSEVTKIDDVVRQQETQPQIQATPEGEGTPTTKEPFVSRVDEAQGRIARTRRLNIESSLKDKLDFAAEKAGVGIEVGSGGQPSYGPNRVGSDRHDDGKAADFKIFRRDEKGNPVTDRNGNRVYLDRNNPNDRAVWEKVTEAAASAGVKGFGAHDQGYMGSKMAHFDVKREGTWGGNGVRIPGYFSNAIETGRNLGPKEFNEWLERKKDGVSTTKKEDSLIEGLMPTQPKAESNVLGQEPFDYFKLASAENQESETKIIPTVPGENNKVTPRSIESRSPFHHPKLKSIYESMKPSADDQETNVTPEPMDNTKDLEHGTVPEPEKKPDSVTTAIPRSSSRWSGGFKNNLIEGRNREYNLSRPVEDHAISSQMTPQVTPEIIPQTPKPIIPPDPVVQRQRNESGAVSHPTSGAHQPASHVEPLVAGNVTTNHEIYNDDTGPIIPKPNPRVGMNEHMAGEAY